MGCDDFSSAASDVVGTLMVEYLVKPVERRLRYLFRLKKIFAELQKQEKNLINEQTRVQADVQKAKRHIDTQVIEKYVEDWLTDAENVLEEARSLEQRIEENKRCFRWCPNWSWRYRLSKNIEQKTVAITNLVGSAKFERVGQRAPLPDIECLKSKDLIASKSSTSAFNEIMEALEGNEVSIIGVWGMGGVGKTTLVTEVRNKVKDIQLFDRVIKVVVSETPIIENIQNKILVEFFDDFDLIKQMDKERKAKELWARLEKEKRVLVILDDMWKELNLKEIGIPFDGNRKGCKIILTTRRRQVCEDMKSQVTVPLKVLDEEEAWTLFRMNARLDNASLDIVEVAKEVAKECGGLPIAIVTLASALRSKNHNGWELARLKLERSRLMDIESVPKEVDQNAYLSLKMSYDQLESDTTRRCFLLCALYPEDYLISVEDLVRYAWGLWLYKEADSIREVRREVFAAIENLKGCCLLSEYDYFERYKKRRGKVYIKLHDVVRDVARWIASNEENGLLTKLGVESENESSKQKLEILLLDEYDSETPIESFEGMPELKVLSIRTRASKSFNDHDRIFSLNALESLTNLRALHLEGFKQLEGISALARLTKLEILSLHGSKFQESIDNLGELKNLSVLDMRRCEVLLEFPPNLIRRLKKVEELYLYGSTMKGLKLGAFLSELNLLPRLASLFLQVSPLDFPKDFVFPKLKGYIIDMHRYYPPVNYTDAISPRLLSISEELPLNVISELLWNVEFLRVSLIKEKDIKCLTDATPGNVPVATTLQNLKGVQIENCKNLQVIFQMKKAENHQILLSKLEDLRLWKLPNLEYIWEIPTQHISLKSLETVSISDCGKLKSLFSFSLAQSLVCLEEIKIDGCDGFEQIFEELEGDEQEISPNTNPHKPLSLPKLRSAKIANCGSLEYIFPMLEGSQYFTLQSLKVVEIRSCKKLKSVFSASLIQSLQQLEELEIKYCDELKTLFTGQETDGVTESNNLLHSLRLLRLKTLRIKKCPRLEYVLPITLAQGLPQLERLWIDSCDELKTLFRKVEGDGETESNSYLQPLCLSKLTNLEITKCPRLEYVLPITLAHDLPQLVELEIACCDELKILFREMESDGETESNSHLQPLCLPKLTTLRINKCPRLEYVLPITLAQALPQLEELVIDGREVDQWGKAIESNSNLHPQLKQVFGVAKEHDGVQHLIELPRLKRLQLDCLTNLSSFGPENYFVKAPALETLCVCACPQLMNFTIQQEVISRVDLKDFGECIDDAELCNNQLRERSPNMMNFEQLFQPPTGDNIMSSLETVTVRDLIWLQHIWKGPIEVVVTNLRELQVYGCIRLKDVFPVMLVRNLPKLRVLKVEQCENLEQIIVKDDTSASSSQSHDKYETGVKNEKETLMFPLLEELRLKELPSLVCFSPVGYHLVFPSLESLLIQDCSPMITSFTADSTLTVHAETKAPRLDDASPSQRIIWWLRHGYLSLSLPPYVEEADEI